jgi:hypothetical protein
MASGGGFLLVWDYNRYGDCNPGAEICDTSYQPADQFHIYSSKAGAFVSYSVGIGPNYHYDPGFSRADRDEYFVRAYSYTYGESVDSNHVFFQEKLLETTINPSSVETKRWSVWNYDGSSPHWVIQAGLSPGELESGYAFTCLNNCSDGQYRDGWYTGVVQFLIPENMDIQSARLNWKNEYYVTSGAGETDVVSRSCGVNLNTGPGGWELSTSSLWGSENFDVSPPVLDANLNSKKSIAFWFMAPSERRPVVRWDRCLWQINNISLTLYYHQ